MNIYDIIKRYKYIIITNKTHIEPLFNLLRNDKIHWSSWCDINDHNADMLRIFEMHPQAFIELELNELSDGEIFLSWGEFWHTNYKDIYKPQQYITSQDLLTASKKSIIILNEN